MRLRVAVSTGFSPAAGSSRQIISGVVHIARAISSRRCWPYDISPAGGVASEARLTGTVPGADQPATVIVTLRLADGVFHMRPSQLLEVPDDEQAVLDGFTFDLDTRTLPLGGPADLVQLTGGSLEFSRDRVNTVVEPADLEPLARASTLENHG